MRLIVILTIIIVCGTHAKRTNDPQVFQARRNSLLSIETTLLPKNKFPETLTQIKTFIDHLNELKISRANNQQIRELAKNATAATLQSASESDRYKRDYQIKPKVYTAVELIVALLIPEKGKKKNITIFVERSFERECRQLLRINL